VNLKSKKLKNNNSSPKDEIRHLGVLIENVNDNVKIVAEQYGDIKNDIGIIKQTLDSHTDMISSIKEDVEIMKTDIEFIKSSLKKKVDVEEFMVLERRVALLERRR
jgi:archaellum component FlaC